MSNNAFELQCYKLLASHLPETTIGTNEIHYNSLCLTTHLNDRVFVQNFVTQVKNVNTSIIIGKTMTEQQRGLSKRTTQEFKRNGSGGIQMEFTEYIYLTEQELDGTGCGGMGKEAKAEKQELDGTGCGGMDKELKTTTTMLRMQRGLMVNIYQTHSLGKRVKLNI